MPFCMHKNIYFPQISLKIQRVDPDTANNDERYIVALKKIQSTLHQMIPLCVNS